MTRDGGGGLGKILTGKIEIGFCAMIAQPLTMQWLAPTYAWQTLRHCGTAIVPKTACEPPANRLPGRREPCMW